MITNGRIEFAGRFKLLACRRRRKVKLDPSKLDLKWTRHGAHGRVQNTFDFGSDLHALLGGEIKPISRDARRGILVRTTTDGDKCNGARIEALNMLLRVTRPVTAYQVFGQGYTVASIIRMNRSNASL